VWDLIVTNLQQQKAGNLAVAGLRDAGLVAVGDIAVGDSL
jgi:hypothetical protein